MKESLTTPTPLYVKSIETKTEKHTADYLSELLKEVLEKYNPLKFLCVITDNAKNMRKAAQDLEVEFPHITSFGCLAHTFHLICGDLLKIPTVKNVIDQMQKIIKTMQKSQILDAVFNETKRELKINKSLHLPVKTRWSSHYRSLKSMTDSKFILKGVVIDDRSNEKIEQSMKNTILDEHFWNLISNLTILLEPISVWSLKLESDEPTISLSCQAFNEVEVKIDLAAGDWLPKQEFKIFTDKYIERKLESLQPIHFAADLLNPKSVGTYIKIHEKDMAMNFIKTVAVNLNLNPDDMCVETWNFCAKEGVFQANYIWEASEKITLLNQV